jgi:hypothetical protein
MMKYLIAGVMVAAFSFGAAGTAAADRVIAHYPVFGACVANGVGQFGEEQMGKTWFCQPVDGGYNLVLR